MRRTELRNYTDDQILDTLMFGLAQVEIIDPPDDLRAEVFRQACSMHQAKQVIMQQGPALLDGIQGRGLGRG